MQLVVFCIGLCRRNPCQEIVLWSPPDASVKKMIGPDEEIADNPSNVTGDMMEDLVSVDTQR